MRIFKFEYDAGEMQTIVSTPKVDKWLGPLLQTEMDLVVYAMVSGGADVEKWRIRAIGTGVEFEVGSSIYLGTVHQLKLGLVWHVFVDRISN